jgi:hypothetical protein
MASINAGTGLVNTGDNSGTVNLQGGGVTAGSVNVNGLYFKSVTSAEMFALTGVNGMIVFNTTLSKMCVYANGAWVQMTSTDARNQRAIFGYGATTSGTTYVSLTNLVSSTGVVATDTTGVGTARAYLACASYGTDKAIFGYGNSGSDTAITNLVSNTGVVATDTTGVGTARSNLAATRYSTDKAIFGYGNIAGTATAISNLVSNTGVVSTDTTGVGTTRANLAAAPYGNDKALFGFGNNGGTRTGVTNLVSNTGVIATDTAAVGTARNALGAAGYGTDKAIFGYGNTGSVTATTNLVSNAGVVATDTTGVGSARNGIAASTYGSDKAIFGYGSIDTTAGGRVSTTNLVSNTGVVANDTTGVGTARYYLAAGNFGI